MSKVWGRIAGLFSNRTFAGIDKAGNRYFARTVEIDGIMKEKRWVIFKGEEDPTSVPVEWICWLNGQRKKAPTAEELIELEARRERVRLNVALLKKEEEERRAKEGIARKVTSTAKVGGPDLKSFIRQFPPASEGSPVKWRQIKKSHLQQNNSQSLQSRQDLVHHSDLGLGNHQLDYHEHMSCQYVTDSPPLIFAVLTAVLLVCNSQVLLTRFISLHG